MCSPYIPVEAIEISMLASYLSNQFIIIPQASIRQHNKDLRLLCECSFLTNSVIAFWPRAGLSIALESSLCNLAEKFHSSEVRWRYFFRLEIKKGLLSSWYSWADFRE